MTDTPPYSYVFGTRLLDELVVPTTNTIQARDEKKQRFAHFLSKYNLSSVLCESKWLKGWYAGLEKSERTRFRKGIVGVSSDYVDYKLHGRGNGNIREHLREIDAGDIAELVELIPISDGFPLLKQLLDARECFMSGRAEVSHAGNTVIYAYARHNQETPEYWIALAKDAPIGTAVSSWKVLAQHFPSEAVTEQELIKGRIDDQAYSRLCQLTWQFSIKDNPLLTHSEKEEIKRALNVQEKGE